MGGYPDFPVRKFVGSKFLSHNSMFYTSTDGVLSGMAITLVEFMGLLL